MLCTHHKTVAVEPTEAEPVPRRQAKESGKRLQLQYARNVGKLGLMAIVQPSKFN